MKHVFLAIVREMLRNPRKPMNTLKHHSSSSAERMSL
jgi:hypothetical protein